MRIIIIIEQTTTNLNEYTVRTRTDAESVYHKKVSEGFTTAEDAQEYAEVLSLGAEIAGAKTLVVASEEIADELEELPAYLRAYRIFNFDAVWGKI